MSFGSSPRRATNRIPFRQRALTLAGLLVLCLVPGATVGQVGPSGPVRGKILAPDRSPVHGALVELIGRGDSVRTSGAGEFTFPRVPSGAEVLRIRVLGYRVKLQGIHVIGDSGWIGTILLEAASQQLPEVEVKAPFGKPPEFLNTSKYDDFFRRRGIGFGTFRTRDDIERMGAFDVVSVLQGIPGVNVSLTANPYGAREARFKMARCPGQPPNIAIYINGRKVSMFLKEAENNGSELSRLFRLKPPTSSCSDCERIAEALTAVALRDIEFVEFYRGPGEIPSDLDRGDSCAALVIWTR